MKKIIAFLLCACLLVTLCACGGKTEEPAASEPAASEPAASEPTANEPAASEPAVSEPAASEPAASEPAASEPAASEPAETKTIALVPPAMISPYYKAVISGAEEAAAELGYELKILAPETESDYAAQVQIVEDMITQGVDGIAICAINSDAIVTGVKKANEAGIPVIMFNGDGELSDGKVEAYVSYNQYEAGEKVCEFAAENLGEELKVAIIEGLPSSQSTDRMGGFMDKAEAEHPGIQVVATQPGDWEREAGMNAAANMLQANPDIDLIYALCDESALGAVQAVKEAGSSAKVIGFDGNPNAVASIEAGELFATISGNGSGTGYECVATLDKIFAGESVDKFVRIETIMVSSENADQFPSEAD